MARTKSSHRWLKEHFSDPFVIKARQAGYRSRAIYKLIELQEKHHLMKHGDVVVDLGAAPGSWSQYIAGIVGNAGKVIAVDLLEFDEIAGVEAIVGDFTNDATYKALLDRIQMASVNCVVSDMLPNSTGIKKVDQLKSIQLVEDVIDFALGILQPHGNLLVKVLQGSGFEEIIRDLRKVFCRVSTKKPKASRARSLEVYLLAIDFKNS